MKQQQGKITGQTVTQIIAYLVWISLHNNLTYWLSCSSFGSPWTLNNTQKRSYKCPFSRHPKST